jgi:hypothetical protein
MQPTKLPFPERVLHQHMAFLGKTGAGKSSAMRVVAEHELDRNKRTAIIDPKGDWWGLKSSADGKNAGYAVITFGNFKEPRATDVPINHTAGAHVAELIATGNRPCVIGFRGWMPSQLTKFWLDFAPALFNTNAGELKVFIDEVHNFAPKGKIMDPDSGKCLHWTNRIMSEGRGLGLTFYIASQRPQKVHNDTLDNCETLVAMRVAHPAARQALKDWIDGNGDPAKGKEVLATLAQLKRGEAWIWSPENDFGPQRVQFPMFSTFDSFAPPQTQKSVSTSGWEQVDLDQVKQKLASVIAEAEANDPKKLKADIARLRAELSRKSVAVPAPAVRGSDPREIERAVRAALTKRDAAWTSALGHFRKTFGEIVGNGIKSLSHIHGELNAVRFVLPKSDSPENAAVAGGARESRGIVPVQQRPAQTEAAFSAPRHFESNGDLSRPQLKLLEALAEAEAIGRKEISRSWLAFIAGVSPLSSGFEKNVSTLSAKGLLRYPSGGRVALTDSGRAFAPAIDEPLTTASLLDRVCRLLSSPQEALLRILHKDYPNALDRETLAHMANVSDKSSGFEKNVSSLSGRELVEYPAKGEVRCADWLFIDEHAAAS